MTTGKELPVVIDDDLPEGFDPDELGDDHDTEDDQEATK